MRSAVSSLRHRPDYGMNNIENKNLFLFFAVILLSTSHSTPHICHCWAFFSLGSFCPLSPPPPWKIVRPPSGTREKSIGFMLCGYRKNTVFYALYFISHVWSRYEFHSPHHTKTAKQFLELSCATSAKTNRYRQISCFPCTSSPFSLFTPGVFPSLPTALLAACKEHHRDDDKSSTRKKFPSSRDYHVENVQNEIKSQFPFMFEFSHQHTLFTECLARHLLLRSAPLAWVRARVMCFIAIFTISHIVNCGKMWNRAQWKLKNRAAAHKENSTTFFFVHLPNYQFNFFTIRALIARKRAF